MPSLTHVCLWDDNHWERVTASDIAKSHPFVETVSASSKLFMCELCGQYVFYSKGKKRIPCFGHSSGEMIKDCPERTFGYGYTPPYDEKQHELPLKINLNGIVSFSLGLICVPDNLLEKNTYVEINLPGCNSSFKYLSDRLLINQVTYLSVGNIPSEKYELTTYNASPGIEQYWPTKIKGIDPTGTWFDAQTGKKLPYDADVVINKQYYLVVKRRPVPMSDDIVIQDVANIYGSHHLKVYKVMALKYSREAACFFLDYHCRLTDNPVNVQPIWPVYSERDYLIKHSKDYMFFLVSGDGIMHLYPETSKLHYNKVERVNLKSRQQFISVGRTHTLRYKYYWRDDVQKSLSEPVIEVTDNNNSIISGIVDKLPTDRIIRIILPYDGTMIRKENGIITEKRAVKAEEQTTVYNIGWGTIISIFIGLDCIWEANFEKNKNESEDEEKLLKMLQSCSGNMIDIPHSIGSLAHHFKNYPKIRQWIYQCVRQGRMPEKALKMIKCYVVNGKVV